MREREHLLNVERIARLMLLEFSTTATVEFEEDCEELLECDGEVEGEEKCHNCGVMVAFKRECENEIECHGVCESELQVDLDDDSKLLRQLELALVELDLARNREVAR